jgi:hypothetical protein
MNEFELSPNEHLVRQTRKHWFLFVTSLLPFGLLAVLPIAIPKLLTLVPPLATVLAKIDFANPLMRAGYGIWLLLLWTSAWGTFTRYFLNMWILTNERIVTIKQHGFFKREVSSLLLPRVQDVTTTVHGVIPSLLGIGNLRVQSAGAEIEFTIRGIPRPEEMRELILEHAAPGKEV